MPFFGFRSRKSIFHFRFFDCRQNIYRIDSVVGLTIDVEPFVEVVVLLTDESDGKSGELDSIDDSTIELLSVGTVLQAVIRELTINTHISFVVKFLVIVIVLLPHISTVYSLMINPSE